MCSIDVYADSAFRQGETGSSDFEYLLEPPVNNVDCIEIININVPPPSLNVHSDNNVLRVSREAFRYTTGGGAGETPTESGKLVLSLASGLIEVAIPNPSRIVSADLQIRAPFYSTIRDTRNPDLSMFMFLEYGVRKVGVSILCQEPFSLAPDGPLSAREALGFSTPAAAATLEKKSISLQTLGIEPIPLKFTFTDTEGGEVTQMTLSMSQEYNKAMRYMTPDMPGVEQSLNASIAPTDIATTLEVIDVLSIQNYINSRVQQLLQDQFIGFQLDVRVLATDIQFPFQSGHTVGVVYDFLYPLQLLLTCPTRLIEVGSDPVPALKFIQPPASGASLYDLYSLKSDRLISISDPVVAEPAEEKVVDRAEYFIRLEPGMVSATGDLVQRAYASTRDPYVGFIRDESSNGVTIVSPYANVSLLDPAPLLGFSQRIQSQSVPLSLQRGNFTISGGLSRTGPQTYITRDSIQCRILWNDMLAGNVAKSRTVIIPPNTLVESATQEDLPLAFGHMVAKRIMQGAPDFYAHAMADILDTGSVNATGGSRFNVSSNLAFVALTNEQPGPSDKAEFRSRVTVTSVDNGTDAGGDTRVTITRGWILFPTSEAILDDYPNAAAFYMDLPSDDGGLLTNSSAAARAYGIVQFSRTSSGTRKFRFKPSQFRTAKMRGARLAKVRLALGTMSGSSWLQQLRGRNWSVHLRLHLKQ
jgi:hypothetical protein